MQQVGQKTVGQRVGRDEPGPKRIGRWTQVTAFGTVVVLSVGVTSMASAVDTGSVGQVLGATLSGGARTLAVAPMVYRPVGPLMQVTDLPGSAPLPSGRPQPPRPAGGPPAPRTSPSAEVRNPWLAPVEPLPDPATAPALGEGDEGDAVALLERRLDQLGYRPGDVDGWFSGSTWSAVLAFQKAEGLERSGAVDGPTWARLAAPRAWRVTSSTAYPRVEIDLERQVVVVALGPAHVVTLNTSTGGDYDYLNQYGYWEAAATPPGAYRVYRRVDGPDKGPLGTLYRPLYFHLGYAIHGSPYVPDYADSHGCARVSDEDMDWLWDRAPDDLQVNVFDTMDPARLYPGSGRKGAPTLTVPASAGAQHAELIAGRPVELRSSSVRVQCSASSAAAGEGGSSRWPCP